MSTEARPQGRPITSCTGDNQEPRRIEEFELGSHVRLVQHAALNPPGVYRYHGVIQNFHILSAGTARFGLHMMFQPLLERTSPADRLTSMEEYVAGFEQAVSLLEAHVAKNCF